MNKPTQCIIIGGGASIREGLNSGLSEYIKDRFVILCNFAMFHHRGTLLTFVDSLSKNDGHFFKHNYEDVINFPLSIARYDNRIPPEHRATPNIIYLPGSADYKKEESFKEGIYTPMLTGIWAITIAIQLLESKGEIFLLGYDWTKRTEEEKKNRIIPDTHYYNDKLHRGIGVTSIYEENKSSRFFQIFVDHEPCIKIYNVNLRSNIEEFEKIDYPTFYQKLNEEKYNQEELRNWIKTKIERFRRE